MNANGTTMPDRGEKILPVILNNGEECNLRMQITDVHRALHGVSRVCDSGHTVTFRKDDNDNDNDNDTLREVPHQSNEGLALQARVSGPWPL